MTKEEIIEYIDKILNREVKPWQEKHKDLVIINTNFLKEIKKVLEKE